MTKLYYSASTGGFYADSIHGDRIPADSTEISEATHSALLEGQTLGKRIAADGNGQPVLVDPPPPSTADILAQIGSAVQAHVDARARSMGYDSIATAVTYADEPAVAQFQNEGRSLRAWRSQVWAHCYAALAAVQVGARTAPTVPELIAELPPFTSLEI